MTQRSHSALLALAALLATPWLRPASAADITRGGKPAELTVAPAGSHSIRVTLKPLGVDLPPSPSLLNIEIKNPAITLRTMDGPVRKRVGELDVEVTPSPLTVAVKGAGGREVQKLVLENTDGSVMFNVGDAPVLGLGEGGQQPGGRGGGQIGVQFDRRGRLDPMRPGWGTGTLGSRNPIAVLAGTDGWGLFVSSPWVQVDLRDKEKGVFLPTNNATPTAGARGPVQDPLTAPLPPEQQPFDVFVFDAAQPADMMKDLRDLTGAPAMPPKWALGYQQSHRELRDANMTPEQLILSEIDTFRQKQIPVDSVVYLGTGFTPTGWNTRQPSFEFNPQVFSSDPKQILKQLHDKNVKVVVHMVDLTPREMPHIVGNIPPLPGETLDQNHILPYWKRHEPLIAAGVDAFWPDEGDRFSIAERMTREQMYYQGSLMTTPNVRPWTINRNGVIGMSKWGAWMWSGDTQSQWNTLRDQVWIGQNVGLSITPYWGSDTGGFYTTNETSGELYARWLQFSAFNGSFRSHGRIWRLRLPWGWGLSDMGFLEDQRNYPPQSEMNNPAIEPIAKKYIELRYQLIPYTYTLTREAYDTGMPLMRALWLHYPADKQAWGQSEEYLWGRDMLIAPVYEKGAATREIYLPAGTWYDFWDNSPHPGGTTVNRSVDLATMPIYVRAGAIIPVDPVRQYMTQPVTEPTTLKVYTGANGEFTLYEDDGNSQGYMQNKGTWTKIAWDDGAKKLTITAAPPAGVINESSSTRDFKIEILPAGTVKMATYNGRQTEVNF
ncbi:MAG TPA: TIM-barrel domain-containing protein [Phycisphaerae bacterium]|nr:TIM-barrel domain-containing protein [Phycisphaerae bacterium]